MANFYKIPHGGTSGKIEGTKGSLLNLPGLNDHYKLIACDGPSRNNEYNFWKGFVLGHQATLVVNLCSEVGDDSSNWYN